MRREIYERTDSTGPMKLAAPLDAGGRKALSLSLSLGEPFDGQHPRDGPEKDRFVGTRCNCTLERARTLTRIDGATAWRTLLNDRSSDAWPPPPNPPRSPRHAVAKAPMREIMRVRIVIAPTKTAESIGGSCGRPASVIAARRMSLSRERLESSESLGPIG